MQQTQALIRFPHLSIVSSPEETAQLAAQLIQAVPAPALFLLQGPMGVGKTLFVRGMCNGIGMHQLWEVDSPTFTIVNHYDVGSGFYHLDLFRLSEARDLDGINLEDILHSNEYVAVEWPERLPDIDLNLSTYLVQFQRDSADDSCRRIRIEEFQP